MAETMQTLDDGSIRVCVEEDGFEPVCCIVSSMHLVYQHLPHLHAKVTRLAKDAYMDGSY